MVHPCFKGIGQTDMALDIQRAGWTPKTGKNIGIKIGAFRQGQSFYFTVLVQGRAARTPNQCLKTLEIKSKILRR